MTLATMEQLIQNEIDILSNEIGNLEDKIAELETKRESYRIQTRINPMELYSANNFRRRFRLTKDAVEYLYSLIGGELEPVTTRIGFTISGLDKILITLRYYATASIHQVIGDFYGISESSVCNIIPVVSEKIAALRQRFIRMPSSDGEILEKKREFFKIAGMPAIIGAMDGTLVKILKVGGTQNKTDLFSRKQYYAINVQIVCDANAIIEDIVGRWPGSIHDQTVFQNSLIFERFLNGEFIRNRRPSLLLGDGGYQSFLAVPLRQTARQRTRAETLYQTAHIATRNVVERFNGQWKERFPCLFIGMRFRKMETVLNVIVATAVLHNLCKFYGDITPPPLTEAERIQFNLAIDEERRFAQQQQQMYQQQPARQPAIIVNDLLRNHFESRAARN